MMIQRNHSWNPWLTTICVVVFGAAIAIVPLFAFLVRSFGVAVSTGINLGPDEPVRTLAEKLLAPNLDLWVLGMLIICGVIGISITKRWGVSPAFPWQAELFRGWAKWGALSCIGLAFSTLLAHSVGGANYFVALTVLYATGQMSVFYMMLLWPVFVSLSALLAYLAGLSLPTHIALPWALPHGIGWIAKLVYLFAPKIDPVLGTAGKILTAIYLSSKE